MFLFTYFCYKLAPQIIKDYHENYGELKLKTFIIYGSVLWLKVVFCWPYIILIRVRPHDVVKYLTIFLIVIIEWIIWMRLFFYDYIQKVGS
jgi:hypothetical protein